MRLKRNYTNVTLLLAFLLLMGACALQKKKVIKIACIGDSITYGHGIEDLENNTYPAYLGKLLGDGYEVKNFGVCGATCLKKGDLPYWDQPEYKRALEFQPDVVVMMLGTNDSKPQNWFHSLEFGSDYTALIDEFKALRSSPKFWICNPPPAFNTRWNISDSVISLHIIPEVEKIAKLKNIHVIDFNKFFTDKVAFFPDMIHPDTVATKLMAEEVANALVRK